MGIRIVAVAPETRSIPGEPAVANVDHRDPDVLPQRDFQLAQHVAKSGLAGDRHALLLGG